MLKLNIVGSDIDQSWTIQKIAEERPPISWEKVFEESKYDLAHISRLLSDHEKTNGSFYPLKKDIFRAFDYTRLEQVKVVIVGQDPYHQTISINGASVPRATGLSFSVHEEDAIPSSLQNIYKELESDIRGFRRPMHGNLKEWAAQGVLMLNMCLTVQPGAAGSHGDIWLGFIKKVLTAINAVNPQCIFVLWGREAQKIKSMLGERPVILEAAHPSGLSANRGFFGCKHFSKINEILLKQGKVGINWQISNPVTNPVLITLNISNNNNSFNPIDKSVLESMITLSTSPKK